MSKIKISFKPLTYFKRELNKEIANGVAGPAQDMLRQWGSRYLAFTTKRYNKMARGGWPRLAKSTLKKRKKGKGLGKPTPLIDQGFLIKGLQRGYQGNLFKFIRNGVRVGYKSNVRHPRAKNSQATYGNIAKWNDEGKGNLPKRTIFVEPDMQTVKAMQSDVKRAIAKLGRQAQERI